MQKLNNMEKEIILYSSDEAAKKVTVTGWVSRDGRFFGNDEHMARYAGCTHVKCECGEIMERIYTKCAKCRYESEVEKYNNLPFKEWDGKTPLYSRAHEKYFFSSDAIEEYKTLPPASYSPSTTRAIYKQSSQQHANR